MDRSFQVQTALIDISEDDDLSSAVIIVDRAWGSFRFPAAMTGTAVTFVGRCSEDESTYGVVYDADGSAVSVSVTVDTIHPIPDAVAGLFDFKFVSNDNELADRTFTILCKA